MTVISKVTIPPLKERHDGDEPARVYAAHFDLHVNGGSDGLSEFQDYQNELRTCLDRQENRSLAVIKAAVTRISNVGAKAP
jgi:hypothetical protein